MIALAMSGVAQCGSPAAHAQETASPRVAFDATRALIGNTLVYAKPGEPGKETGVFLHLDGTGMAAERGPGDAPEGASEPRPVRWADLSDGNFCVTDIGRKPWDGDCGRLAIDGSKATLTPAGGPAWTARVLEGDAWKLDPATPSARKFAGRAAIDALVGNTLVFPAVGGGREYRAHYFTADGRARRAHNDQPYFDNWALQPDERWSIRQDRICLSGGAWKTDFCAAVSIAGDLVTLRDEKAGPVHAILLQGDARNLSLAAAAAARKIADALTGHTMRLKAADRQAETDSSLYFLRDGTGRGERGAAPTPFKWLVQPGGNLCIAEGKREFRNGDCVALSIDGDAVTLAAPGRPAIPGRLVKGNALTR